MWVSLDRLSLGFGFGTGGLLGGPAQGVSPGPVGTTPKATRWVSKTAICVPMSQQTYKNLDRLIEKTLGVGDRLHVTCSDLFGNALFLAASVILTSGGSGAIIKA